MKGRLSLEEPCNCWVKWDILLSWTDIVSFFGHRDEDEQEEYQERIALQLVDQEDEDINRIKEESRRRTQAILEKYKTQQLQQQHEPHLEDKGKLFDLHTFHIF